MLVAPSGQTRGADPKSVFLGRTQSWQRHLALAETQRQKQVLSCLDGFDSKASPHLLNFSPLTELKLLCWVLARSSTSACEVGSGSPFYKSGSQGLVGDRQFRTLRALTWGHIANTWQGCAWSQHHLTPRVGSSLLHSTPLTLELRSRKHTAPSCSSGVALTQESA